MCAPRWYCRGDGQITRLALALASFSALLVTATDAAAIDTPAGDATDAAIEDTPTDTLVVDAMSSVMVVTCPGSPDLEISAATGAYVPQSSTIAVNAVVRFTPGSSSHDMVSGTPGSPDGRFATPLGQTTCLRFTAAGTFPFFCNVHSFTGTITVN